MKEKKQQELQEKYMEIQMLDQQMKQIQQQSRIIDNQAAELGNIADALDDLKKVKQGTEILFPISNGIFLKGNISNNKEVNINVGGNVVVSKTIDEAKELIKKQLDEIKNLGSQINIDLHRLGVKARELEKDIIQLSE